MQPINQLILPNMYIFNHISLPIIILLLVFIAIAVRKVGKYYLPIWLIMLVAALIVLVTGKISIKEAYDAISFEVLFYLFGVFVVGQALESSHYLEHMSFKIFNHARSLNALLFMMVFVFAIASAFLMNDTIAIIGTPVILFLARQHHFNAKPFLLTLAYAITLGSVMSPVGNPQNLLIANSGMVNPFVSFFSYLTLPTIINLLVLYLFIWLFYRDKLVLKLTAATSEKTVDSSLARLSQIAFALLIFLIIVKVILGFLPTKIAISFSAIALIACAPILLFSNKRWLLLKKLDWHTILFFIGLFIFMKSVWLTHYFQGLLAASHVVVSHKISIYTISVLMSQLISNVPLVALYLPLLKQAHIGQQLALAAGSTVAGNLLILGAASNVIIIQNAEKRGQRAFSFWEFFKIGLPLTVVNVLVYFFLT